MGEDEIMNIEELKELVKSSESEQLEFKLSTGQGTEAVKTVCAMLNGATYAWIL